MEIKIDKKKLENNVENEKLRCNNSSSWNNCLYSNSYLCSIYTLRDD